eukprot:gene17102-8619_t
MGSPTMTCDSGASVTAQKEALLSAGTTQIAVSSEPARWRAKELKPVRTTGNGSCLFNASSIALIGNESLSVYLRCLTSIEMFQSSSFYAYHPIFCGINLNGKERREDSIFTNTLSDVGFKSYHYGDRNAAVLAESINVAKNLSFSSLLCMTALSTAIGVHIESYFPTKTDTFTDVYEVLHNRILSPRPGSVTANCDSKIHIFHCASMPPDYLKTMKVPEKKDHFVPFKAPPLFSINLMQRAVSSSHVTKFKSGIRSSGPGTKRKATILDHFSAKAAKSENFPCHKDSGNSPSCSTSLTCNVDLVPEDSSDSHSISEL